MTGRRRPGWRVTDWRAYVAFAVWLVASLGLAAIGARPAVIVLAGIVAAVGAAVVVVSDLTDVVVPVEWPAPGDERGSTRGTDRCLTPLRNQLDLARRYDSPDIHLTLVEVVDDRLRDRHRVDRAVDPDAAAAVLAATPTLARLVAGPPRPLTSVRELRQIVTEIEAL